MKFDYKAFVDPKTLGDIEQLLKEALAELEIINEHLLALEQELIKNRKKKL